ncbi:MAG: UDP-N-acetylmuramoyl-tripeptide--D-alanyl-D-alanine ligase [Acidaminococcales bacterium]|jgi:UDP-N-acetylmuramoyl-tripeptide--D-alanyl-D-alanine ligase|nr:UDP-N-acetylmuramoyl-tripeptide--D-alanyl-D-alanine ligase [Acidaminococcales bacterium]
MLKISELCQATGGATAWPYEDAQLPEVVTDSRLVSPGVAFVAIVGQKFDGHDFCAVAAKNGAKAIVAAKPPFPPPENAALIMVKDTLAAYQEIAAFYRNKFALPIIAVTGSVGKTTTKDLIAAALGDSCKVLKSQANFNNEIGLPATLLKLTAEHKAAVVELGMRGAGQIRQLAKIAKPAIGVVTNVGNAHIELLGSVENIAAAKQELIEELDAGAVAVLNADDHYVSLMGAAAKGRTVTVGFGDKAEIRAVNILQHERGLSFTCQDGLSGVEYQVNTALLGRHNVYNMLCAIAAATLLGVKREDMLAGLSEPVITKMRQNIQKAGGITIIDDTYNASPASMKASLELLRTLPGKRRVAVLGDMLELGALSGAEHENIGRLAARNGIDFLITIGEKSHRVAREAGRLGVPNWHFQSSFLAADIIKRLIKPGDTVLFKASRGIKLDELLAVMKKYWSRPENET